MAKGILSRCSEDWTSDCGRYNVRIGRRCLENLARMGREHYPRETGASVYGSYSRDGFQAMVLGHAPVARDSLSQRFAFRRGVIGARRFFADLFARTRGEQHYIGEWHTHPGGSAEPSGTDNRTLRAIATDRKTGCPECILLILAGDLLAGPSLGVYVYSRERGRIRLAPKQNGPEALRQK